jgi:large subunit ribosomal protein L24
MQKIIKGDTVKVMLGKDNGREGVVEKVLLKEGKIFIGGINLYKRHVNTKRMGGQQEGGIIEIIKPLKISNVQLVCPSCKKITRVGFEVGKEGKLRICRKCGKPFTKGTKAKKGEK